MVLVGIVSLYRRYPKIIRKGKKPLLSPGDSDVAVKVVYVIDILYYFDRSFTPCDA